MKMPFPAGVKWPLNISFVIPMETPNGPSVASIAFSSTVDSNVGTGTFSWIAVDVSTGLIAGSADTLTDSDSPYFATKYCCSSIASVCSWVATVDWLIAAIRPPLY